MSSLFAITADDVRDAAKTLAGIAVRTPLLEYAVLNERAGRRVLVKFEGAQHTGSFKFRGAYNRLARIKGPAKAAGVVAWSSGNHAQGVAAAAKLLGMPAVIVMPADAPAIKAENTRALGAEIVFYDRARDSREDISAALAAERGATLVAPFNDAFVMAGQGTIGLEILAQAAGAGAKLGQLLTCCGGGGLTAGVAVAVKDADPSIDIYSVEPAAFDDTARSLRSGQRETIAPGAASICDALLTPSPGEMTFPINQALLAGGLGVTDEQVKAAMRFAFEKLKLVIEPGGAVALAALLHGLVPACAHATAVIVSGSNVDPAFYAAIIAGTV
jgi:threonine dehydratase